ncbi:MAG: HEAT repeat domain-containing protein, partial [Armatimonadota bacterium]|nr:HEAT repeat domain-containing protein [Armatimonadota bacterium]
FIPSAQTLFAAASGEKKPADTAKPKITEQDTDEDEDTSPGQPAPMQPTGPKMSLEEALQKLPTYKFGDSRQSLDVINDAIRAAKKPEERAQLAQRLTALLSANASRDAKDFICRTLWVSGTAESVPALAALLTDEDLSHMARYALQGMAYPEAGAALRDALGKVQGKLLVGVINSLAERGDMQAVDAIAKLVDNADSAVAAAAVAALARIGGTPAGAALAAARAKAPPEMKALATNAYLLYADRLGEEGQKDQAAAIYKELYTPTEPKNVRLAALRGLVMSQGDKAIPVVTEVLNGTDPQMQAAVGSFIREMPGTAATAELAGALSKLSPGGQAVLLEALAARGAPEVKAAALDAIKSQTPALRLAAVRALANVGDASAVPLLAQLAATGTAQESAAALLTLERLRGAGIDEAIAASLEGATPKVRAALLRSLGARKAATALPTLMKAVDDPETDVRLAAFNALAIAGGEKDLPALLKLVEKAKTSAEQTAAEKMLVAVTAGLKKESRAEPIIAGLPGASVPVRQSLLRVLGGIGGENARKTLVAALQDENAEIQDAAIRTLAKTTDVEAAPTLLELAKTAGKTSHRVLALQGYIKLAGTPDLKAAARLQMYKDAMAAAQRTDEKRAVLAAIANAKTGVQTLEALNFALPLLEDAAIQEEAASAVMDIVAGLPKGSNEAATTAARKVLEVSKGEQVRQQATDFLAKKGKS